MRDRYCQQSADGQIEVQSSQVTAQRTLNPGFHLGHSGTRLCPWKVDQSEVPTCDRKVNIFSRNPQIRSFFSTSLSEPMGSSAHTVTSCASVKTRTQKPRWLLQLSHSSTQGLLRVADRKRSDNGCEESRP